MNSFGAELPEAADTISWRKLPSGVERPDFFVRMNLASDKPAIFEQCFETDSPRLMDDPKEPKKETVRIPLASQSVAKPPGANLQSRDAVRIQLPLRQPSTEPSAAPKPPTKAAVLPQFFPAPPPPPVSPPEPAIISTPMPGAVTAAPDSLFPGPKNETARIPLIPEPAAKPAPTVQMKKTQPLVAMPQIAPQGASVALAPAEMANAIPMTICWTLLGVSAVILIIQIWTYFS